jgi:hypothetical protein
MYNQVVVEGKGGISAKIVLDSVSSVTGSRMVTYEIECHRYIWAEVLTHKMLSRNAASSRAIPVAKMFDQCKAEPIYWGKNKSGMQATEECFSLVTIDNTFSLSSLQREYAWDYAKQKAIRVAKAMADAGYHKQITNRLTEPFQMMKAVISATEWDNFFWLRNHEAAQPEIAELARCMYEARQQSVPQILHAGEWHLPYVECNRENGGALSHKIYTDGFDLGFQYLSIEDALKVSAARSAAVSFRNCDYGLEKSREVWERLVGDERKHSSAMEHCAKVMLPRGEEPDGWQMAINHAGFPESWEEGVSHATRDGGLWSGNLKGFVQLRKLIDGECCWNYEEAVNN